MKVDLSPETTKHTFFRIMPRYKVRAEGDFVRIADQVVLESVKTAGQFLHSTAIVLPHSWYCLLKIIYYYFMIVIILKLK